MAQYRQLLALGASPNDGPPPGGAHIGYRLVHGWPYDYVPGLAVAACLAVLCFAWASITAVNDRDMLFCCLEALCSSLLGTSCAGGVRLAVSHPVATMHKQGRRQEVA